jgi:DNA-binding PadR family transcriptional regulator
LTRIGRYLHINAVRRKPGTLVPLEQALCLAAAALRRRGLATFHGFLIAKEIRDAADTRLLTAYGTLYRALARLEEMGLVTSVWEDAQLAADEGRPRRRLYSITDAGLKAAAEARAAQKRPGRRASRLADA